MSALAFKRLSPSLKEIRIHLCPRSPTSNGTRQFIDGYYTSIKRNNPNLPILIRECTGIEPKIWFRFEYGKETSSSLSNLKPDQVAGLLKELSL